jgi:hypothetical protein
MLHHMDLIEIDVSEECIASIIRETRIGELEATLAVTSNRSTTCSCHPDDGGDTFLQNVGSLRATRCHIPEDGIFKKCIMFGLIYGYTNLKTSKR